MAREHMLTTSQQLVTVRRPQNDWCTYSGIEHKIMNHERYKEMEGTIRILYGVKCDWPSKVTMKQPKLAQLNKVLYKIPTRDTKEAIQNYL